MIQPIISPTIAVLDEWEKVIDDITLVYRIKSVSGDDESRWYSVACWQRGVPSPSAYGKFAERPDRAQVETRFEKASAHIVQAAETKSTNYSPSYNSTFRTSSATQEILVDAAAAILPHVQLLKKQEILHDYTPRLRVIFRESEWLKKQSNQIFLKSAALSARLALLNARSKKLCKI